jgi:transposase-like protein
MKHSQIIHCTHCDGTNLRKNGHSENGTQRWYCVDCKKSFQLTYRYNAWNPGIKEQITEMTLNSSGIRDIGRNLRISNNTVVAELKKKRLKM